MSNIMKRSIETLLPPGSLWVPKPGADFDLYLDGQADNLNVVKLFLQKLADVRNPFKTELLDDLEKEYGITKDIRLTEEERRQNLASVMFATEADGSEDFLETQLNAAGFGAQVYQNDPATDPEVLANSLFQMVAGGDNAYAGRTDAFASVLGGTLLVNGDIFKQIPLYTMQAGGNNAFAGNQNAVAGEFDTVLNIPLEFVIPTDPNAWPFVFFVGGDATRNVTTNKIEQIELIDIPTERKQEFERLILKYKPLWSWCIYFVNFT